MLAFAMTTALCCAAQAQNDWEYAPLSNFGNDSYAAQIGYDSFRTSVRKRFETIRVGESTSRFGSAAMLSSDAAFAMAPSSRSTSYSSARRRQLDCVYNSGFTIWGDLYQTWARQRSRGDHDGYKYRVTGPALGFDWTSGPFTVGVATTYNWGKMKSRDFHHDRKTRTWAVNLYSQYNSELFYINASLGYAHNRFKSDRNSWSRFIEYEDYPGHRDSYNSNSWNLDAEFGWKFNFGNLKVVPNVGLRYFHDRRGSIKEDEGTFSIDASSRNYHVLELPVGVNVSYEIQAGGAIIVPRARFAWIPELSRKKGGWSGTYVLPQEGTGIDTPYAYSESSSRRSRHGFLLGLGLEAKLSKSLSLHIDYNCNFRSKNYEHHWNLGAGFTF